MLDSPSASYLFWIDRCSYDHVAYGALVLLEMVHKLSNLFSFLFELSRFLRLIGVLVSFTQMLCSKRGVT